MGQFHFNLQTVLNYRQATERQAKEKLAGVLKTYRQEQAALENYRQELATGLEPAPDRKLDLRRLQVQENYRHLIRERIRLQSAKVLKAQKNVEQCQNQLEKAMQERKIMEKLKEHQLEDFIYQENQHEQKEADDLALSRYARKPAAFSNP